jgi:UDP-N-acetylmuramyl pentapeptide phosphotransferase/UDP-N-acetylglucosamine-1-phosphate transferase
VLLWVVVLLGLGAVVASVRLPRPHHRVALGMAAAALVLVFWPVACATAIAAGPAGSPESGSTSCTSATGLRVPSTGGIGIVLGGLVLLGGGSRLMRRRRPPGGPSVESARTDDDGM